jgi:PAS domain S-box-containing protein
MSPKEMGFKHLLEAVPDALVGIDQEGVIRFVNRQTESLFGYDRDQVIGRPIETLVPEPLWQIYAQHRESYFADPRTRSSGLDLELSGRQQDGTEFPINISLSHIDTGDILLVVTAARDVARRRQAVKNAQLLAAIVDSSDDAIISGTLELIITSWNPAAERIYGYSREEIIGQSATVLIPDDRPGEMDAIRAKIRAGEAVEHFETNRVRKDGTVVPISLSIAPIFDEEGAIVGTSSIHRDVTRQRQTYEVAQRMMSIVEGSADAIFGCRLDGTITSWNPAAERMYGYSSEQIVGQRAKILTPGDRVGEMMTALEQIKAGRQVEQLETERVRKDGTVFPVSLTISPVRDADGAVVGTSVIHRDRTEQTRAFEEAQHLASIVENSDDAIISRSLDGKITSWNPAAERMYGYSRAEMIGRPDTAMTLTSRAGEIEAVLERIIAGRQVEHLETKRVRKNGTVFPVSLSVSPVRDADGAIVGTSVIHRDLTEQKGALASAERMAAIVEYSDEAIIGRTLDGIVTSWNPAAERMFGYAADEIVGQPIDLLDPEDQAGETISILAKISAGQPVDDYETRRVRKDGTVFPVSLTISPIRDEGGAVVSASVICRDQSEVKRAAQYARSLIETDPDPLGLISPDGTVLDLNEATVKATGVPRNELIGTDFSRYWTDPDKARKAVELTLAHGSVTDYPLTARNRDGTLMDALCNTRLYRDVNGQVLGVLVAARDLTAHKKALAAAELMASIVEFSQDAIVGTTLDGIVTSWNPAAQRMFGYSGEEMVGKSVDLTIPRDQVSEAHGVAARVSAGEPVEELDTVRVRKDGTLFPVSLTVSPIRDADGAVFGSSVICRDVSETRRAAQYARGLIEADPDPLGMVSPDGTVLDVNEATVRATGVPRDELIGSDFAEYWTDPDTARQGIAWAFEHGSLTDGRLTARHRDGTLTDYLCNATVYRDINGEVLGVLTSARDVTRQTLARRAIAQQQAKELERLEELEQFRQLTLGRELRMIELKKEIEYLRQFGPDGAEAGDQSPT